MFAVVHLIFPSAGVDGTSVYLLLIGAATLYRKEIVAFLSRLRYFKDAGLELDLRSELDEAARHARNADRAAREGGYEASTIEAQHAIETVIRESAGSPQATILLLWGRLERAIVEVARARDVAVDTRGPVPVAHVLRALSERRIVPAELLAAFDQLRQVRNKIAHGYGEQVSEDTLWRAIDVCAEVLALLPPSQPAQEQPTLDA